LRGAAWRGARPSPSPSSSSPPLRPCPSRVREPRALRSASGDRSAGVSIRALLARRQRNADQGIISRRERSRGAKIDHVAMVRAVRNGTERNGTERNGTARHGPASLIPSADQKGKKRNDQAAAAAAAAMTTTTTTTAARATFGLDNYPRVIVYTLYTSGPAITRFYTQTTLGGASASRVERYRVSIRSRGQESGGDRSAKIWILLPPV